MSSICKIQLLQTAGSFRDLNTSAAPLIACFPRYGPQPTRSYGLYVSRASEAAGITKSLLLREVGDDGPSSGRAVDQRTVARSGSGPPPAIDEAMEVDAPPPAVSTRATRRVGRVRRAGAVRWVLMARSEIEGVVQRVGPEDAAGAAAALHRYALLKLGA